MAEETPGKASGGGGGGFVIALLLLAVVGAGSGAGFSLFLLNGGSEPHDPDADKRKLEIVQGKAKKGDAAGGAHKSGAEVSKILVANLDPILVALSGPQRAWARLELGIVLDGPLTPEDNVVLKSMTEDIMSFMRTVPLVHVESAAGIEYLREDLEEIARLRSNGRTRSVILRSLVVE